MPWLTCYLNPLTLTCLGHEMAASCLTFLLCRNVTVSSYSFMVIADKKRPQPYFTHQWIQGVLCCSYIFCLTWSGCRSDFLLFADSDGDKFAALLAVGGRVVPWKLEGFEFILCGFSVCMFCDDTVFFSHPSEGDFLALCIYGFLINYFSVVLAVTMKTFYCHYIG